MILEKVCFSHPQELTISRRDGAGADDMVDHINFKAETFITNEKD